MRHLLAVAVAAAALAVPAVAQDTSSFTEDEVAAAAAALEELQLDETTYQQLWCGAAFVMFARYLTGAGEADAAAGATAMSDVLFDRVGETLTPEGYTNEELQAIGMNASIIAIAELNSEDGPPFSQDDCTAAAQ